MTDYSDSLRQYPGWELSIKYQDGTGCIDYRRGDDHVGVQIHGSKDLAEIFSQKDTVQEINRYIEEEIHKADYLEHPFEIQSKYNRNKSGN